MWGGLGQMWGWLAGSAACHRNSELNKELTSDNDLDLKICLENPIQSPAEFRHCALVGEVTGVN